MKADLSDSDSLCFLWIDWKDVRWEPLVSEAVVQPILQATLRALSWTRPVELSLVLTNDTEIARLNSIHRNKTQPTNVLSFPAHDRAVLEAMRASSDANLKQSDQPIPLGDLVLSFDTIQKEASHERKAWRGHCSHLIVHGLLHLLGFDHEDLADAYVMEHLEVDVLHALNISNPYASI